MVHPLAGKPAPKEILVDVARLRERYGSERPDPESPEERVAFGTSGHRGSAERRSFNEGHVLAITQAVCEYRKAQGTSGPLYLGMDTHALSEPAHASALEVLAANGVETRIAEGRTPTATPLVSHAILAFNRGKLGQEGALLADGLILTPSHNPPEDGGIKYNPPHGGPADTDATGWIEARANELLARLGKPGDGIARTTHEKALRASTTRPYDYVAAYVDDLRHVIDLEAIAGAKLRLGTDPLGGSSMAVWEPLAARYGLSIAVTNPTLDGAFSFMPLDHDGKIRMDCSSAHAMANLVALRDKFDLAFGNDADADRHGIVTPRGGLLNPNHFLAVAIDYLFTHRSGWRAEAGIGKTLVSSAMIDRVAERVGRRLVEVPVGFKWFVPGLSDGSIGFGGEESAGASFLRKDGTVWTTDKDGILLDLLAAEILAVTGKDPALLYAELEERFGPAAYVRLDRPASRADKARLKALAPEAISEPELAGEPILHKLTRAPGNGAAIGGLKVATKSAWFAARPSGTEDVYKIYAESLRGPEHLARVVEEASAVVDAALRAGA